MWRDRAEKAANRPCDTWWRVETIGVDFQQPLSLWSVIEQTSSQNSNNTFSSKAMRPELLESCLSECLEGLFPPSACTCGLSFCWCIYQLIATAKVNQNTADMIRYWGLVHIPDKSSSRLLATVGHMFTVWICVSLKAEVCQMPVNPT